MILLLVVVLWLPAAAAHVTGRRELQSCGSATFVALASGSSDYPSSDLQNCYDSVACGDLCKGDGECGTSDINNCDIWDVYKRSCSPPPTVAPAPTPDGCVLYVAGPVVASHGNKLATVDSLQNYELAFTMELASDWSVVGNWQSVIHIGNTDGERFPGIWFEPNLPRLKVYQHYSASWNSHYSAGDVAPASGAFEAGKPTTSRSSLRATRWQSTSTA